LAIAQGVVTINSISIVFAKLHVGLGGDWQCNETNFKKYVWIKKDDLKRFGALENRCEIFTIKDIVLS